MASARSRLHAYSTVQCSWGQIVWRKPGLLLWIILKNVFGEGGYGRYVGGIPHARWNGMIGSIRLDERRRARRVIRWDRFCASVRDRSIDRKRNVRRVEVEGGKAIHFSSSSSSSCEKRRRLHVGWRWYGASGRRRRRNSNLARNDGQRRSYFGFWGKFHVDVQLLETLRWREVKLWWWWWWLSFGGSRLRKMGSVC